MLMSDFNGGIFLDDEDIKTVSSQEEEATPALDFDEAEEEKIEETDSEEVLFDEGDEEIKEEKTPRASSAKNARPIPEEVLERFSEISEGFDPEAAPKKEIRQFRKMLAEIMNIRYPKKPRDKKKKAASKPTKASAKPAAKKVAKKK